MLLSDSASKALLSRLGSVTPLTFPALHCGLALMEACNELLCGTSLGSRMSPEGLRHINMALRLVNERLADRAAAVSDTTVGIIIMLIIREQICQQGAVADVHFRGLLRIVELRGGLEEMEASSRRLVLKICKLDVSSAWQFGRPLHFYRNRLAAVLQEMAALDSVRVTKRQGQNYLRKNCLEVAIPVPGRVWYNRNWPESCGKHGASAVS